LQLDACVDWNADTGATSHMTPHRHWLRNYVPKQIPIKLADNNIIYSTGEGTVVFNPIVNGKQVRPVEFSRVLTVTINATKMSFERPTGSPLFAASISDSNSAFLNGQTVPIAEYASAATTLPLDLELWHRRLAHHHLAGVRTLTGQETRHWNDP
jgi:hypothetical protein